MERINHPNEPIANALRYTLDELEPRAQRTYTPTKAVIARSAGVYHWTSDGRKLFDCTSGVLVTNLGHNPSRWLRRLSYYMGWPREWTNDDGFTPAIPLNAYNAITPTEVEASRRLIAFMRGFKGGSRIEKVLWAASGSEAVHKALWAAMSRDRARQMIVATRNGFHGKKGLANAVSGSETDPERDPRVKFISFPMEECCDISLRGTQISLSKYQNELDQIWSQYGRKIGVLITEPYLGGGGSFHPHKEYLQLLQRFCRENDIVFVLDEVQSNFGRTGKMFAYEKYGIEPDIVVLGKGLGNGVPIAAAVGRSDILDKLDYGEGSDTWSANPLCCAAVLATIDEFEETGIIDKISITSEILETGLLKLKEWPIIKQVRGEYRGFVWGVELNDYQNCDAANWARKLVLESYYGDGEIGVHLMGPLARKVIRFAPPLVISKYEANQLINIMCKVVERVVDN